MKADILRDIIGYFGQIAYTKDLLAVKQDIERNKERLQSAPNFTFIVECALQDSYLLALMRLYEESQYEESQQIRTISNLIKKCEKNIHLFPSQNDTLQKLEEFRKKLKENSFISYAIEVLRTRRDHAHVHNDKQYFGFKILNDDSSLDRNHIIVLIEFAEEVLNYLFSQLSSDDAIKPTYNQDLRNLLEH